MDVLLGNNTTQRRKEGVQSVVARSNSNANISMMGATVRGSRSVATSALVQPNIQPISYSTTQTMSVLITGSTVPATSTTERGMLEVDVTRLDLECAREGDEERGGNGISPPQTPMVKTKRARDARSIIGRLLGAFASARAVVGAGGGVCGAAKTAAVGLLTMGRVKKAGNEAEAYEKSRGGDFGCMNPCEMLLAFGSGATGRKAMFHAPNSGTFRRHVWRYFLSLLMVMWLVWNLADRGGADYYYKSASNLRASIRERLGSDSIGDVGKERLPGEISLALIFDRNRLPHAAQLVRSVMRFANPGSKFYFHLIVPRGLEDSIYDELLILPGTSNETTRSDEGFVFLDKGGKNVASSVRFLVYDHGLCERYGHAVMAFSDPGIHLSAHCKFFLSEILQAHHARLAFMPKVNGKAIDEKVPDSVFARVLYVDNDVTAVQDITPCWRRFFSNSQFIGMSVDQGDICQYFPNLCWPLGFEWVVPPGLFCGNVPSRSKLYDPSLNQYCPKPGQTETYQFNGGVVLMDLEKMRKVGFTEMYVNTTVRTARNIGFKKARWGEQDFINSFFRVHPDSLHPLPCGCNYQFTASRREVKCPNQPVYLAHGWSRGVSEQSTNLYNHLFFYFRSGFKSSNVPPAAPTLSAVAQPSGPTRMYPFRYRTNCPHQSDYDCQSINDDTDPIFNNDPVYILTRTSGRPKFFHDARRSVMIQSHPHIRHLVVTDDRESFNSYLANGTARVAERQSGTVAIEEVEASRWAAQDDATSLWTAPGVRAPMQVRLIKSLYSEFDKMEPCRSCGGSPEKNCANAPPLSKSEERTKFLNCFCETHYPMNTYVDRLHEMVVEDLRNDQRGGEDEVQHGWIVYLDDDNMLTDPQALTTLLAHARSTQELVLWKSHLGRITPSDGSFGKSKISIGDIDASGYMFHTSNLFGDQSSNIISATDEGSLVEQGADSDIRANNVTDMDPWKITLDTWGSKRCGDYRTAHHLSQRLSLRWINSTFTGSHPLRAQLGGLGMRSDVSRRSLVTVIVTAHVSSGFRSRWLESTVAEYTSLKYLNVIDRILLVWNNPEGSPAAKVTGFASHYVYIGEDGKEKPNPAFTLKPDRPKGPPLFILHQTKNSLNNRWTTTIDFIETDAVLNIDDDIFVNEDGITCMLVHWLEDPTQIIGPFARQISADNQYIMDERFEDRATYSLILPRIMLLNRRHLLMYRDSDYSSTLQSYVDSQEGHCDDITLNAIVAYTGKKPPFRVILPPQTVIDYYEECHRLHRMETGGLALQKDRTKLRSECTQWIQGAFPESALRESAVVGTCGVNGRKLGKSEKVNKDMYGEMKRRTMCDFE
ncbi:glycosyl transferase family 64 domain-containing protein [Cladochytrium replicatum]|nr:glycosyl transferase family 64 domain-containing protein [Cladochytrium replicatum]